MRRSARRGQPEDRPDVDASDPVSTTVCLPTFATTTTALGVAATIAEGPAAPGDPGHPALGRSVVCIAALGQDCGAEGSYTPYDFGTTSPVRFVFRISAAALAKGDKITQVFHNGVLLPKCREHERERLRRLDHARQDKTKIWTIVATAPTNGSWTW